MLNRYTARATGMNPGIRRSQRGKPPPVRCKVGALLTVIVFALAILLVPRFWPLQ